MSTTETQGNEKAHKGMDLFNALVQVRSWMQDKHLRSWMAALLVVLVAVPAIGMVITSPTAGAWVFAGFFAVAWLLLLFAIVRPQHITAGPLAVVVVLGLIVEAPLASPWRVHRAPARATFSPASSRSAFRKSCPRWFRCS